MSNRKHLYRTRMQWLGDLGSGTSDYKAYSRDFVLNCDEKPEIPGSADPVFRGDGKRWNPEDLLVASVSSCHQLWYLHLCADAGIVVTRYEDEALGEMQEDAERGGYFTQITLQPKVTIKVGGDIVKAQQLHQRAHELCFIANSLNFPVHCEAQIFFED